MRLKNQTKRFYAPSPNGQMQAVWLTWPHNQSEYTQTFQFLKNLEPTYIQIVESLQKSESLKTRIIVHSQFEKDRVQKLLFNLNRVQLFVIPVDDIWIRDNGPCFIRDEKGHLNVLGWGFNGWGGKVPSWELDQEVPFKMAKQLNLPFIDLKDQLITEGGAHQFDGKGLMIATECSILNPNRNQEVDRDDVESLFKKYYGIKKFIWLLGEAGNSITDMHIDGYVRIANDDTLLTYSKQELRDVCFIEEDIERIYNTTNCEGKPFKIVEVPVSKNTVPVLLDPHEKTFMQRHGSYLNFFKGNDVVLVPTYNDPNDQVAVGMFKNIFPKCTIAPIDCVKLYYLGGMLHCITQQQPISLEKEEENA